MSEIKDDDLIVINTEQQTQVVKKQIETFRLVSEKDPILKEVMPQFDFSNPPVDPTEFASSLVETCKLYKGLGLSANQCGFKYRVFVMGAEDNFVAFFNPKIISTTDEVHMIEGCLSFPFLGLHITRPKMIDVEYQDFKGEVRYQRLSGISARCFLHELDHMNGILYTEKVKPLALQMATKKRKKVQNEMKKLNKLLEDKVKYANSN
jgi:peptide deformylase